MWKAVCGVVAVVLALAWGGDAAAARVELTRAGNDTQNVWCDTNARQLAQGATLNVQIQGRSKSDATITGKIRMKSETDKFEWASGEPTVTFTRQGSNPTSFGVKAKSSAPAGTYSIKFAAVDDRNDESGTKSCSIEVVQASRTGIIPPRLPVQGPISDLPTGPGRLIGKEPSGQTSAPPPFTVALSVNPASGATWNTTITLKVVESGTPPPIKTCQYRVFPMAGGPEIRTDWVSGCSGYARTLAPGTYLLQVDYRYKMGQAEQEFVTGAQLPNYVVAPAPEAKVNLDQAGNDPATGWCDINAKQLARGSTMNVGIQGRTTASAVAQVAGKIRIKSPVPLQWASGEPSVTFTSGGSNPTTFGITANSAAPLGTYAIAFAASDDTNLESPSKVCKIEVVPRTLALTGTAPQQLAQTFSLKLSVAPASGVATSDTPLTMRLLKEGTWNPPSVICAYYAIPTGGGRAWSHGPDVTCATPSPTLVAGTYTISFKYQYQKPDGSPGAGSSEVTNYVVNPSVSPGPIVPQTPLLLQVAWVEASSLSSVAEARITVCTVDVDAAYSLNAKGRRGSSDWEEVVSIPRAGDWAEFHQGWDPQSSWGSHCPINQSYPGRLDLKLQLKVGDCCSTITYQVVATNRRRGGGKSYSNLKTLNLPNFWPCPQVPVCVPADGTYDKPQ